MVAIGRHAGSHHVDSILHGTFALPLNVPTGSRNGGYHLSRFPPPLSLPTLTLYEGTRVPTDRRVDGQVWSLQLRNNFIILL